MAAFSTIMRGMALLPHIATQTILSVSGDNCPEFTKLDIQAGYFACPPNEQWRSILVAWCGRVIIYGSAQPSGSRLCLAYYRVSDGSIQVSSCCFHLFRGIYEHFYRWRSGLFCCAMKTATWLTDHSPWQEIKNKSVRGPFSLKQ